MFVLDFMSSASRVPPHLTLKEELGVTPPSISLIPPLFTHKRGLVTVIEPGQIYHRSYSVLEIIVRNFTHVQLGNIANLFPNLSSIVFEDCVHPVHKDSILPRQVVHIRFMRCVVSELPSSFSKGILQELTLVHVVSLSVIGCDDYGDWERLTHIRIRSCPDLCELPDQWFVDHRVGVVSTLELEDLPHLPINEIIEEFGWENSDSD